MIYQKFNYINIKLLNKQMKIKDLFKLIFSDEQLEKDVDIKAALQFPTEDGLNVLECDSLEVGQPVSLVDADGNKTTPEDGDYEITDETGAVNVVTVKSGVIETVEPGADDSANQSPNETEMAKAPVTGDPVEDHPLVKEAKEKLEAARAKAKVEAAKCELEAIKGKKKNDAPVEVDEKAKPAGSENPDEEPNKGPAPAKKGSVVPKKLAKKLSTEKPGDPEPKAPGEKGGFEVENKVINDKAKPLEEAAPKAASVGNKYANAKLSAAEKLRKEMEPEVEEVAVQLSADEELKKTKADLALAQEKIKVLMSQSKPLKVTATTVMDKVQQGDQKLSKSEFIKKHVLGREDV